MAAKADALPGRRPPSYLLLWRRRPRPRRFRCLRKNKKEYTKIIYRVIIINIIFLDRSNAVRK